MRNYTQFHDGHLEGLWIEDKVAYIQVRTADKTPFTFVGENVERLTAGIFKEGNIILDAITRDQAEITQEDIAELYDIVGNTSDVGASLLRKARQGGLKVLEINPSYGASCLVLAQSIDLLPRREWAERYSMSLKNQKEQD